MEGHTFNDINFAANRPWSCLTLRPKGWPGGTTGRHVCQVKDEDRLVIRILRGDAHTVAPTRGWIDDGLVVGTHDKFASIHWCPWNDLNCERRRGDSEAKSYRMRDVCLLLRLGLRS